MVAFSFFCLNLERHPKSGNLYLPLLNNRSFSMRNLLVAAIIIIALISACGPSEQKRKEANDVYSATLEIIGNVNLHDSEYVHCMQYLMREIQSPDIKKNKKKSKVLSDSISMLDEFCDSLMIAVSESQEKMEDLRAGKSGYELLDAADSLLSTYNTISKDVYKDINNKMKKISLPVKDAEYTTLLRLSYRADSVLNGAVASFNNQSAAFYEQYGLKDFRK
ncbi:hypothetical protein DSECCO2_359020 [anaerobic digester metagenome]